ncbi:hypothetical protein [Secundilactobacillus kimchicus]|nr:hypothetical protein [Secundilactobacillus kimchicus]
MSATNSLVANAGSAMATAALNGAGINGNNPGDLLAAGFNRAYAAVNNVVGAMRGIGGNGLAVNGQMTSSTSLATPTTSPFSYGPGTTGAVTNASTATQTSSSNTINIQPGAISLTSTGDADIDGEAIARALENHLMKVNERMG